MIAQNTSLNKMQHHKGEYGDIGAAYLKGFNKPHSLNADDLETLGRKL